jgi:hypothetical protein
MEFVPIFTDENQGLYSFIHSGQEVDEFERLFDLWEDTEFLEEFFNSNLTDLQSGFFGTVTVDDAVLQTIDETRELRNEIFNIKNSVKNRNYNSLDDLFIPLHQFEKSGINLVKHKAYGLKNRTWIRLYALKLENNYYFITGGCIKLTDSMKERPHTNAELSKLDSCRDYLLSQGIIDKDGLSD